MSSKLIPLGNKIVVVPIKEEEKTKSGLIIPSTGDKTDACHAVVVSVGKGYIDKFNKNHPLSCKEGDIVLYGRNSGTEYFINGEKHLIISDDNVLGVVKDKKKFLHS